MGMTKASTERIQISTAHKVTNTPEMFCCSIIRLRADHNHAKQKRYIIESPSEGQNRVNWLLAAYSTAMGSTRRNCLARSFPVCSPYTPQIPYLPLSVTFHNHSKLCIAPSLLPKLLCSVRNRSSQVHTSTIPKQIASVPSLCT